MIRIGILGKIGSGKSYVANSFGYPVFNADKEVSKIYKSNKKIYYRLKKKLPSHINKFPINKSELTKAILSNKTNLKKIIYIVHQEVRKKMRLFLKKNLKSKIVILDIPLLLENKINNKKDILIFVDSKKIDIDERLKKRTNFNSKLFNKFSKIQHSSLYKKRRSNFIIKNDFTKNTVKKNVQYVLNKIL